MIVEHFLHGVKMPGLAVLEGLAMHCVLDRIQMSGLEPVEIKDLVVEDCKFKSTSSDPWIEVKTSSEIRIIFIEMKVDENLLQSGDALRIYYSNGVDGYTESMCEPILLGRSKTATAALYFEAPVMKLRFDFTERRGRFPLEG